MTQSNSVSRSLIENVINSLSKATLTDICILIIVSLLILESLAKRSAKLSSEVILPLIIRFSEVVRFVDIFFVAYIPCCLVHLYKYDDIYFHWYLARFIRHGTALTMNNGKVKIRPAS